MADLPVQYQWLALEPGPRMILEALKLFGTIEAPGKKENNPTIIAWAKEVGGSVADIYKADEIAWCGLFMAVVAQRSSKQVVKDPLWALNWGTFGVKTDTPMLGDTLAFIRKGGGHVGLYIGEDATAYHVLGGNQSDKVCITRVEKSRLYAARRPKYNIQPANVRKIILASTGKLSINEA
ncbi:MAG: TIGR02594 family protein [Panacibacter sp.]